MDRPFLQVFPQASSEAEDLLHKLLHFNPHKRITAEVQTSSTTYTYYQINY
jgi:hypothetical protein